MESGNGSVPSGSAPGAPLGSVAATPGFPGQLANEDEDGELSPLPLNGEPVNDDEPPSDDDEPPRTSPTPSLRPRTARKTVGGKTTGPTNAAKKRRGRRVYVGNVPRKNISRMAARKQPAAGSVAKPRRAKPGGK
jgi:hypothetical protein